MEEWKEVVCNNNYIVSNTGRIRRINSDKDHSVHYSKGYQVVDLYEGGKRKTRRVHRLVAEAFVPKVDGKTEVNHIDGNKENNSFSNLEWVTKQENIQHEWKTGLGRASYGMQGKKNPNGGRKPKPFRIVETGEEFRTLRECEKAINGNNRHISECLNGKQKTHRGYHFEYI